MGGSKIIARILFEISVILSIPSSLIFCTLNAILLIIILPYRQLVKVIAPWCLKSSVRIVSPFSQIMGNFDSTKSLNICRVFIMGKKISLEKLQDNFVQVCEKKEYSKLKKFVKNFGGYLFWQDEIKFDIRTHIRETECDRNISEEDLKIIISKLQLQTWEKNLSPWEILIMNNYGNDGHSIWILNINHIMADGFSILKLIYELTDEKIVENTAPRTERNSCGKFVRTIWKRTILPYRLLRDNLNLAHSFRKNSSVWDLQKTGVYYSSWTQNLRVNDIKQISDICKVSFESTLLCALSGAFRKFNTFTQTDTFKDFVFFKSEPFRNHPGGLTNYFSYASMKMTILQEDNNVMDLMEKFQKQWLQGKSSTVPQFTYYYGRLGGLLPTYVNNFFHKQGTMLFTNFAGPKQKLHIDGNEIMNGFSAIGTPTWETGLTIVVYSWNGTLSISGTMHQQICHSQENLNKFMEFVEEEVSSMKDFAVKLSI